MSGDVSPYKHRTPLLTDLPAREVVVELTQRALLADVAAATGAQARAGG